MPSGTIGCQVAQLGAKWHIGLLTVNVCQCLSAKWHIGSWVPSGSEWILVVILVNGHICLLWPVDNFFSVNVYNFLHMGECLHCIIDALLMTNVLLLKHMLPDHQGCNITHSP